MLCIYAGLMAELLGGAESMNGGDWGVLGL